MVTKWSLRGYSEVTQRLPRGYQEVTKISKLKFCQTLQVDILQQVLIRMLVKRYKKSGMSRKMQRMVIAVVGDEVMTLPATGTVIFP